MFETGSCLLTYFSACVTSLIRVYYSVRMFQTKDTTYNFVLLGLWANVEITLCITCGCVFVLPRFFQILRPQVLYFLRACYPVQPQRLGLSGFLTGRGKAHKSTCTARGPYELQGGNHSNHAEREGSTTNSEDVIRTRSLAPSSNHSKTYSEDVDGVPKKNQILKTVVIETIRDRRPSSDVNVEDQLRELGW